MWKNSVKIAYSPYEFRWINNNLIWFARQTFLNWELSAFEQQSLELRSILQFIGNIFYLWDTESLNQKSLKNLIQLIKLAV